MRTDASTVQPDRSRMGGFMHHCGRDLIARQLRAQLDEVKSPKIARARRP
jgi:hypothetical protein